MWNVLIFKFQKAKKTTFLGTRKIGWIFSRSTEIILIIIIIMIIIIIIFFSNKSKMFEIQRTFIY